MKESNLPTIATTTSLPSPIKDMQEPSLQDQVSSVQTPSIHPHDEFIKEEYSKSSQNISTMVEYTGDDYPPFALSFRNGPSKMSEAPPSGSMVQSLVDELIVII